MCLNKFYSAGMYLKQLTIILNSLKPIKISLKMRLLLVESISNTLEAFPTIENHFKQFKIDFFPILQEWMLNYTIKMFYLGFFNVSFAS